MNLNYTGTLVWLDCKVTFSIQSSVAFKKIFHHTFLSPFSRTFPRFMNNTQREAQKMHSFSAIILILSKPTFCQNLLLFKHDIQSVL